MQLSKNRLMHSASNEKTGERAREIVWMKNILNGCIHWALSASNSVLIIVLLMIMNICKRLIAPMHQIWAREEKKYSAKKEIDKRRKRRIPETPQ